MKGPDWIQIGTEGGFLPKPVVIPSQPMTWNMNAGAFNFALVDQKSLFLGCAERADVIVDFSAYAGKTLILYNDSTAPVPAYVSTYDFYTGDADQTETGGAPPTIAGYGPNTRTIMQIRVGGTENGCLVSSITCHDGGSGYTEPRVEILGNSSVKALATAVGVVDHISLKYIGIEYATPPNITITGGGGHGAKAVATVSEGHVIAITLTDGGSGYTSAPEVIIDPPYPNDPSSNISPAYAKATLKITGFKISNQIDILYALTNQETWYTSVPRVIITDRRGTGSGATATANLWSPDFDLPYNISKLEKVWAKGTGVSTKRGVFEVSQPPVIIPQAAYNSAYGYTGIDDDTLPSTAADIFVQIFENSKTFRPINKDGVLQDPVTLPVELKAVHDEMGGAYDTVYGRMSGMFGLEVMDVNSQKAQFLPFPFASPPVDIVKNTDVESTQIGTLRDGTQIWKIIHNGVDTHPIHVHLFNAQLINRVAWDGIMMGVDDNELGWKETFRVNPLEQLVFALRPIVPNSAVVPFELPNSIRLIDPTMPEGAVLMQPAPAGWFDPAGNSIAQITNHYVNYGWEYMYHCHILAHEEMDMMHAVSIAVAPRAPTELKADVTGNGNNKRVTLTWKDNASTEDSFTVQRAASNTGPWTNIATLPANSQTYSERVGSNVYYYQVVASITIGDTVTPGMPTITVESLAAGPVLGLLPPAAPTGLSVATGNGLMVALTWMDNADNEAGFTIERAVVTGGIDPVFSTLVNIGPKTNTGSVSYTDTAVVSSASYQYRVLAFNAAGLSVYTNIASITIPPPPPAPTNALAKAARVGTSSNDRVTITWTDVATETGYTIQMSTAANFAVNLVTTTLNANVTTFTTGNLPRNTTYYFRIRAFNYFGQSAWVIVNPSPIITP